MNILKSKLAVTRDSIPIWQSCFAPTGIVSQVAEPTLRNKLQKIVSEHNQLHALMLEIAAASARLELAPLLEHHEMSCATVAIAKQTLTEGKIAAVVVQGYEVTLLRDTMAGAKEAKAFLEKNEGKWPTVPDALWHELRSISAYAGNEDAADPKSSTVNKAKAPVMVKLEKVAAAEPAAPMDVKAPEAPPATTTHASSAPSEAGATCSGGSTRRGLKRSRVSQ